ncbi:MAG: C39 family peptidase [Humibacillus sp.]|nr:C39 family peptidase [Humibacillus sp.]MDN5779113.1 C39 family peptidase [Humibacillus sp.]
MTDRHASLTVWEDRFDWEPADPFPYADVHAAAAPTTLWATRKWCSPVVESAFAATELIPSWNASTPTGSWVLVEARVRSGLGWTPWLTFARWCDRLPSEGGAITRTTVEGQTTDAGHVAADAFVASPAHPFSAWQVRLTGLTAESAGPWPEFTLVAASVSAMVVDRDEGVSPAGPGDGIEVVVPPHSQRLHIGSFPEWDGGGASWCSPTSTTMLLEHWGAAPGADDVAWVGQRSESAHGAATANVTDVTDAAVVHAVSRVFDQSYGGAGNWAFNVAYAATRGLRAYVTRLRDLREAEAFVAAGIPLVVSVSFTSEQLDGAGYDTDGHLLTIIGFTAEGDVISNDPNSHRIAGNDQVRAVYRRDQFEGAWLGHDGGLTYVLHPRDVPLPPPPSEANWA